MSAKSGGNELLAAVSEGIKALRQGAPLRTHRIQVADPPAYSARRITSIRRRKLRVSQSVFAGYLGVSPSTVRAWEQNQRTPSMLARRLLQLADERPQLLRELAS